MLTQAWLRGAQLPNDVEAIQRATGTTPKEWARAWPLIERYWRIEGQTLVNDTQLEVYADAMSRTAKASARGKRGAQARWQARAIQDAQASPQGAAPSPPGQSPPITDHRSAADPADLRDRAREALVPNIRGSGVLAGSLQRDHLDHVFCDYAHCVPRVIHAKFTGLLSPKHGGNRDAASDQLKAWYPTVVAGLPPAFVMGDAFRFWQAAFDTAFASKTNPESDKFYNAVNDDAVWKTIVDKGVPK
jgi:uncharacterized protein YdaU (DUF1376 family)